MSPVLRYLMTRTWMSGVTLVIAVLAAILTYVVIGPGLLEDCPGRTVVEQGANIDQARALITYGGIAALVALLVLNFAPQRRRLFALVLLLEGLALVVAIGLVAADSATYVLYYPPFACLSSDPYTEIHHLNALFAVWGLPVAFLLLRAVGAWNGTVRSERNEWPELAS